MNLEEITFDYLVNEAPKPEAGIDEIQEEFLSGVEEYINDEYKDNPEWNSNLETRRYLIETLEDGDTMYIPLILKTDYFLIPAMPISTNKNRDNIVRAVTNLISAKVTHVLMTGDNPQINPYITGKHTKFYKLSVGQFLDEITGGAVYGHEHNHDEV